MRIVSASHDAVPGLGSVQLELPAGLSTVVGQDGRVRRLAEQLLSGRMEGARRRTAPAVDDPLLSRLPDTLRRVLEDGGGHERAELVVEDAAHALAWMAGYDRIKEARERLAAMRGQVNRARSAAGEEEILARIRELESSPEALSALEDELRGLRADDIEVTGDLDAAKMVWTRERQDAEARLQSYRERARELKERLSELEEKGESAICPTCQRPLADHLPSAIHFITDEWEDVVQDGRWWRKRREQLELKPSRLQELEGRSLRLRAATETLAEKVEVARTRVRELAELRARLADLADGRGAAENETVAGVSGVAWSEVDGALKAVGRELLQEARDAVLGRVARILGRITAGRILSVRWTDSGQLELSGVEGPLHPPADEDGAAALVAARIAFVEAVAERVGGAAPPLLLADAFDRMEAAVRVRTVELLRDALGGAIQQALIITRGEIVDLFPEAFDAIVEVRRDAVAGPSSFRLVPGGLGVLRLA